MDLPQAASSDGTKQQQLERLLYALRRVPQGEIDDTHFDKLEERLGEYCTSGTVDLFVTLEGLQAIQVCFAFVRFCLVISCVNGSGGAKARRLPRSGY